MELPIPNKFQKLWDAWDIRCCILFSLFLQAFLVSFFFFFCIGEATIQKNIAPILRLVGLLASRLGCRRGHRHNHPESRQRLRPLDLGKMNIFSRFGHRFFCCISVALTKSLLFRLRITSSGSATFSDSSYRQVLKCWYFHWYFYDIFKFS